METIHMSKNELRKGEVIAMIVSGKLTQRKAGQELSLSIRQIKRLCKRYRLGGLKGLAHRNRGKSNNRKIDPETQAEVLDLIKNKYPDFGPQLIKEQLEKRGL